MTFHIGQQNGGVINNVGRDQTIHGGQQGTFVSGAEVSEALTKLRVALDEAHLPPEAARSAAEALDEASTASAASDRGEPDRKRAAGALERLTRLLVAAGPLTSATAALVGPLDTLGRWLGPLGAQILKLLPAL